MKTEEIRRLAGQLDAPNVSQEEAAWAELRPSGEAVVPFLLEAYPRTKKWKGRLSLVSHAIRYARASQAAFDLGIEALKDKATLVRYRACGLLAYSLKREAIAHLKKLLGHSDARMVADAEAAIDAINSQYHHYFIDRGHNGCNFWVVNDADKPKSASTPAVRPLRLSKSLVR